MIFMNLRARSSRATGPKMRVPIGSFWLSRITAALSSNRMNDPSLREIARAVRTTTARRTSPFLTRALGIASLTDTTIRSPTDAYRRREPPSTRMHATLRAPELSATSNTVSVWIMDRLRVFLDGDGLGKRGLHFPAFSLRDRPVFDDPDLISDVAGVALVVGHEPRIAAHVLL